MTKYIVQIPIAGSISIEVEAEDREAAKEAAWAKIDEHGGEAGEVEWEYFEKLTRGNVLSAPVSEIDVSEA